MANELVERMVSISHQQDWTFFLPVALVFQEQLHKLHTDKGFACGRWTLDEGDVLRNGTYQSIFLRRVKTHSLDVVGDGGFIINNDLCHVRRHTSIIILTIHDHLFERKSLPRIHTLHGFQHVDVGLEIGRALNHLEVSCRIFVNELQDGQLSYIVFQYLYVDRDVTILFVGSVHEL